jgi:electron transfer flavoprotein alpha subunit
MILVIAEQRAGVLNRVSWETVAAAQQLAGVAGGMPITIAVAGGAVRELAADLATASVASVVAIEHPLLDAYTADGFVQAFREVVARTAPAFVAIPHTYQTRDFAPALAARLERPLITDVIGVKEVDGRPAFVRPLFQGKLVADVVPEAPPPCFVTCQVGAFRADAVVHGSAPAPVSSMEITLDASAIRQRPEAPFREAKQAVDLSQAERIVAVGRGIKSQEHVPLAETLAAALGAELGASRPICDSGWLPMDRQIGSSGQTVAPKLYVALGVSGAIQHLVGMKASRTIVAINKDPDAPIFEVADFGIVGDLFEVVPALIAELRR